MRFQLNELWQRISSLFEENFTLFGELGAAISLWQDGKELIHLYGGFREARRETAWTQETLVLLWSATKGLGSACLLHALQEHNLNLDRRVIEFWPEFGQAGKADITLGQLLSHQAGLCALDLAADLREYEAVITALEKQAPLWPPGLAHGYHARTFGFLVDELVRRIAGKTVSVYWREIFAEPLHLDVWIGLPRDQNDRVATTYAAKKASDPNPSRFYRDLVIAGTLARKAFTSPRGLSSVSEMNSPSNRALPLVSFGGIGSATSLAKFYAVLANRGYLDHIQFFKEKTIAWMKTTLTSGMDRVFQIPTAFSAGFMKDAHETPRKIFGPSPSAFGHPGAGGTHAFADPENGIAFAYVMNQMEKTVLPNKKSLRLIDAVYSARRPLE